MLGKLIKGIQLGIGKTESIKLGKSVGLAGSGMLLLIALRILGWFDYKTLEPDELLVVAGSASTAINAVRQFIVRHVG